jgi:squalene-associated FAD-dependent desaturase
LSNGQGRVHVIGAGLAGLSAAMALVEAGRAVTIHEAGPAAGGRCRSYFDRELGCRIDNGNHLLLSGNHAAMRYLDQIGTRHTLGGPATPIFPFIDLRRGERWCLRPNTGRLPWWVFVPSRGVPGASLRDYARLLVLRGATPTDTVAGLLPHNALYEKLIEPLAVSALNTPAREGSAQLFWAIIAETLARGGAQCIPLFPKHGLSESFVDPAIAHIEASGGQVRTGDRIAALKIEDDRLTTLSGPAGQIALDPADRVILAVPAPVASSLLPGLEVPTAHEAIINLHYKWTIPPTEAGFIGLIGGLAEWAFIKPDVVSVTISAANRLLEKSADDLAQSVWAELRLALGIVAEMPPWRLIREKRATFAATPEQHMRRPGATMHLPNLVLAGDWTNTRLPATIEGAIRSGFAAAQHVTATPSGS